MGLSSESIDVTFSSAMATAASRIASTAATTRVSSPIRIARRKALIARSRSSRRSSVLSAGTN